MKKKLAAAALAAGVVGLFAIAGPDANAAGCETQTSQARDEVTNEPTGEDTIVVVDATGSTIYGASYTEGADPGDPTTANPADGGYAGVTGERGYLDVSGSGEDAAVQGSTGGGELDGKVTAGSVCVNGNNAP